MARGEVRQRASKAVGRGIRGTKNLVIQGVVQVLDGNSIGDSIILINEYFPFTLILVSCCILEGKEKRTADLRFSNVHKEITY